MRSDAKKNLQKVAAAALKDPLANQRDIAEATGQSLGSVNDKLNKLEQSGLINRTEAVVDIEDKDLEIVELSQKHMIAWMKELTSPKREDVSVLNQTARESQKRYSMLSGGNTDNEGGEKESDLYKLIANNSRGLDETK